MSKKILSGSVVYQPEWNILQNDPVFPNECMGIDEETLKREMDFLRNKRIEPRNVDFVDLEGNTVKRGIL